MKPYPRYKPTGLAWLPSVPEHWEVVKNRLFLRESCVLLPETKAQLLSVSQYDGVTPFPEDRKERVETLEGYKVVDKNDLVMNIMLAWNGSSGVSAHQGVVSPAYAVFKILDGANPRFIHYLFRSDCICDYFKAFSTGVVDSRLRLYPQVLARMWSPLPPPSEQDRIVRYLDEKTAAIDELVRAKEREIELLRERKQALVSAAVTGGLDPATERKDSGVPWIGKIPKGWNVLKLRQILSPVSEKNRPDLPLLSVVREKGVIIRDKDDMEENRNFIPDDLSGYKVVRKGQFVMNKMKAWQGSYGISPCDGIVSPAYFVFNIRFDNLSFFHFAIRSRTYVDFFAQASDGIRIGQWDLNIAKMKEIPFLVPPAEEQREIVERLPELFSDMDRKIAQAERSIALLQELRTRLVSDAVTGAVEVS